MRSQTSSPSAKAPGYGSIRTRWSRTSGELWRQHFADTLFRSHTGSMYTRQLTAAILDAAIEGFEAQKRRIDEQIAQIRQLQNGHSPATTTSEPQTQPRRKRRPATRKRMGEAQSKRWAVAKSGAQTASEATAMPKRKLSAAGRAA